MVDKGSTTQGKVTSVIGDIFKISHGYAGYILSNLANKDLQGFVEDCNDKHMVPWATVRKLGLKILPNIFLLELFPVHY